MPELFKWEPPSWIDREAWDAFVEMRKEKGKRAPFTQKAKERVIIMLDRLRKQGHPPAEVLWQSVMNGWSGVFPVKNMEMLAPESVPSKPAVDAKTKNLLQSYEHAKAEALTPESHEARRAAMARLAAMKRGAH